MSEEYEWQTARHSFYPTTDIATSTAPPIERALLEANSRLLEIACSAFGFEPGELWLRDQFVVKYSADAQRSLAPHRDASSISYVVALNDAYEGGGTCFLGEPQTSTRRLRSGEALLFCGKRLHEGKPVTRGTRYIVTGFLDAHASPRTASLIEKRNRNTIRMMIRDWDLSPMAPTRPYLRSNTYRVLGPDAARRGDISSLASADAAQRWPYALLGSTTAAASKVLRHYGASLSEEEMHRHFHRFLTDPRECAGSGCHMAS
jgi:hypothetical protein